MTLIITAVSGSTALQVTDRRLTFSDGSVDEEMANKSVIGQCQDARFVLSYTGSSRTKGRKDGRMTDWWAANCLFDMQLWNKPLAQLAREFTKRLMHDFAGACPTTFVWAGFEYRDVGNRQIARMFVRKTSSHPNPAKRHKSIVFKPNFFAVADGCVTALSSHQIKQIAGVVGQGIFSVKDGKATVEALVPIFANVAIPKGDGRFIGRNCRGLVLTPDPTTGTEMCCYSEQQSSEADTPLVVFPGGVNKLVFTGDEDKRASNPSWSNLRFGNADGAAKHPSP